MNLRRHWPWPQGVGRVLWNRASPAVVAALAGVAMFALIYSAAQPFGQAALLKAHADAATAGRLVAVEISRRLTVALSVAHTLAAEAAVNGVFPMPRFQELVRHIQTDAPTIRHVAAVVDGVIVDVAPRAGNEAVLGIDLRTLPDQWPMVQRALERRETTLDGPIALIQGGRALVERRPVIAPGADGTPGAGEVMGVISVVISLDALFADLPHPRPDIAAALGLRFGEAGTDGSSAMLWGDAAAFSGTPQLIDIPVPGTLWQLAVVPAVDNVRQLPGWALVRTLEILAALGTAVGAYLLRARALDIRAAATERAAMLENLRRSSDELEQFTRAASHDLQEPLRMIASYLQLLQRRYQGRLDADADAYIAFAVEGARRMRRQIVDLVAFTSLGDEGPPLQRVSASSCLNEALETLKPQILRTGAHIRIDPLPEAVADGAQLVAVFRHLVGNALHYRRPEVIPDIHISAIRDPDDITMVRFTVADNGPGIAPQYRESVFQVFRRLVPPAHSEGSGMGLALCRRIVQHAGGRIWLDDAPDLGTTVHFTLRAGKAVTPIQPSTQAEPA